MTLLGGSGRGLIRWMSEATMNDVLEGGLIIDGKGESSFERGLIFGF